jgi:hypothetical protein
VRIYFHPNVRIDMVMAKVTAIEHLPAAKIQARNELITILRSVAVCASRDVRQMRNALDLNRCSSHGQTSFDQRNTSGVSSACERRDQPDLHNFES